VAVDLPHYPHHPHLQSCWRKNLGLVAVVWETATKVDVARHPLCPQMRNISPRPCPNALRFLVFDSETADEPVSHAKSHLPLRETNTATI
jgi:hypothetical protein